MSKDFLVKLFDGTSRADDFMTVFGRTEVCVTSFIPELANLPGFDEAQLVYKLDFAEISNDELMKLADFISERFKLPVNEVLPMLGVYGLPILASDCTLTILNPQRWIDLDDRQDDEIYEDSRL